MSSDEESPVDLSSLRRSVKGLAIPTVKRRGAQAFLSIFEETRGAVPPPTAGSNASSELGSLNQHFNRSLSISPSRGGNKFDLAPRRTRRRRSNVFAKIFDDALDGGAAAAPAGESRNQTGRNPAEGSDSSPTIRLSGDSNQNLNGGSTASAGRQPFLRPRAQVKPFSRAQVRSFANAFSSDDGGTEEERVAGGGVSAEDSTASSGGGASPKLHAQYFNSRFRRRSETNTARRREDLVKILNDDRRGSSDLAATKNRFPENESEKSSSFLKGPRGPQPPGKYGNVPGQDGSSFPGKRGNVERANRFGDIWNSVMRNSNSYGDNLESNAPGGEDPRHLKENYNSLKLNVLALPVESRESKGNRSGGDDDVKRLAGGRGWPRVHEPGGDDRHPRNPPGHPHGRNAFHNDYTSSDVTFDSDVVLHSTLRNTPVVKPRKGKVSRNPEFAVPRNLLREGDGGGRYSERTENRRSSSSAKHKVNAEGGSPHKAKPDRSEGEQVSRSFLESSDDDDVRSRRTDASKRKNQTGSGKGKLGNRRTGGGSRSQPPDVLDHGGGVSSHLSESGRKPTDTSNRDKVGVPSSRRRGHGDKNPDGGDTEPESPLFDEGKRNSEWRKFDERLPAGKAKEQVPKTYLGRDDVSSRADASKDKSQTGSTKGKLGNQRTRGGSRSQLSDAPDVFPDDGRGVSSHLSDSKRKPMDTSNRDRIGVPNSRRRGDEETPDSDTEPESEIDKGKQNSEWRKLDESLPASKGMKPFGKETILDNANRPAPVFNNSERILSDVSDSRGRSKRRMSKSDKAKGPASGEEDDLVSLVLRYGNLEQNLERKESNENLATNNLLRTRGREMVLDLNRLAVSSRASAGNSENVSGSRREPRETSKRDEANVPNSSRDDGHSEPESPPLFLFDKLKRKPELNVNRPADKLTRSRGQKTTLDLSRLAVSSQASSKSENVSGSRREPREPSKRDEANVPNSGRDDGDSQPESPPLFPYDTLKRKSESNVNRAADKRMRSRVSERVSPHVSGSRREPSVSIDSERGLSHVLWSEREAKEQSKRHKSSVANSSRNGGDSEPDSSPLFRLGEHKREQEQKKPKENRPADKPVKSRGGAAGAGSLLRGATQVQPRKFVVRANTVKFRKPAEWVNNRFYNKLLPYFETKVGPLRCFSVCEDKALELCNNVKMALKKPNRRVECVNKVRKILYDFGVIRTPMDFMVYADHYLPNEFGLIAIPKVVGSGLMGVPYPEGVGLFDDLKLG